VSLTLTDLKAQTTRRGSTHKEKYYTCLFDSSYPTGGEPLTPADLGLSSILFLHATPASGYSFEYDFTNQKLIARTPIKKYTATHDALSVASNASINSNVTVTGVGATDVCVSAHLPVSASGGIAIQAASVTAADTIALRLTNAQTATVDLGSLDYAFYVASANGAGQEVANTTDLSAVTTRLRVIGT
jgi:hypothetical protein